MRTEKFLKYPPERDIVFVMGAGASYADGVPLQKDILPTLFDDAESEIASSAIGKQLIRFIAENFYVNSSEGEYPRLEAIFGFLDYLIQQKESLNARYNQETIVQIRENLIKLIHFIVNLRTDRRSPIYHRFWEIVLPWAKNVSFVTLNYDTLLEQAFEPLFPSAGYLDYCIHLMNYEQNEALGEFHFWANPREPVTVVSGEDPVSFKIIKLHGSLNWKYCNCCNQVLLTTWDRKIDLNRGVFVGYTRPEKKEYDYFCPLDGTEFNTLILPPSYMKALTHPVISQLFGEASREIRAARKIIFIGYALSDADLHVRALLKKHIRPDTELIVVNRKSSGPLKHRYVALSKNTRFCHTSFEALLDDENRFRELVEGKSA